jgi:AcrR family transcriptional regulator
VDRPPDGGGAGASGRQPSTRARDAIIRVVLELLESGGYDAVALREVARRAQVSLATVYKLFPTRDDLIVAAVERWMAESCYAEAAATEVAPSLDESLYDGLLRILRYVFEPWERSPWMLAAYHRARTGPGGQRLDQQGMSSIEPVAHAVLDGADPAYAAEIKTVLTNMAYALVGRFADGVIGITDILPTLERTVYRLTANNAPEARAARLRRARRRSTPDGGGPG